MKISERMVGCCHGREVMIERWNVGGDFLAPPGYHCVKLTLLKEGYLPLFKDHSLSFLRKKKKSVTLNRQPFTEETTSFQKI